VDSFLFLELQERCRVMTLVVYPWFPWNVMHTICPGLEGGYFIFQCIQQLHQ
jgi:hypothetical protein